MVTAKSGQVKINNSVSFEYKDNCSSRSLPIHKRSILAKGIRKKARAAGGVLAIQNWW
jgi:hypothetical protein